MFRRKLDDRWDTLFVQKFARLRLGIVNVQSLLQDACTVHAYKHASPLRVGVLPLILACSRTHISYACGRK